MHTSASKDKISIRQELFLPQLLLIYWIKYMSLTSSGFVERKIWSKVCKSSWKEAWFNDWGTTQINDTLPFQLKSQTASDWSLTNIEVLLTSCTPSVSRFPETGFLFTWCHTTSSSLSSPCTWILLKWFLKCFPNIEQRCQKKNKEQYFIHGWLNIYILNIWL